MYSIFEGYRYGYKDLSLIYNYKSGLSVYKVFSDYREIKDSDILYLKKEGFNYVEADYCGGLEKPENWKDFNIIETDMGMVYFPFYDLDEVIRKKDEYTISQGWKQTYRIVFVKFISLSDIKFFCKFTPFIQIGGKTFPFCKSMTNLDDSFPTFKYYKDKFYIKTQCLEESQICFLSKRGFSTVIDIPENEYDRQKYPVFPISFTDIEGFLIEKRYCDINDFGKTCNPKLTDKKEVYFLDRKNPDPKVWEMVKKHNIIEFYDF